MTPADRTAHWVGRRLLLRQDADPVLDAVRGLDLPGRGRAVGPGARELCCSGGCCGWALFGLIHGLVFWFGDILLLYALSGLVMLLCRSWSAKKLLWVGGRDHPVLRPVPGGRLDRAWRPCPPDMAAKFGGSGSNPFAATPELIVQSIAAYKDGLFGGSFMPNAKGWVISALFMLPIGALRHRAADDDRAGPVQDRLLGRAVAGLGLWPADRR